MSINSVKVLKGTRVLTPTRELHPLFTFFIHSTTHKESEAAFLALALEREYQSNMLILTDINVTINFCSNA